MLCDDRLCTVSPPFAAGLAAQLWMHSIPLQFPSILILAMNLPPLPVSWFFQFPGSLGLLARLAGIQGLAPSRSWSGDDRITTRQ